MTEDSPLEKNKKPISRVRMLDDALVAVAAARHSAKEDGALFYVDYVDEHLFPFLKAERDKAKEEEDSSL
jgi:hypothetical protein